MMRAVQYFSYGGGSAALKHVEVPIPRPEEEEVVIKVEAASLNPIDWRIQEGILRPILPPKLLSILPLPIPSADCKFPYTPGIEVAGEVTEVGANVKTLKKGDKVVSHIGYLNGGGLAQFVVAQESLTVVRPIESDSTQYASLPVAGVTALQILKSIGAKFDGTGHKYNILITAASGGVGHFLVQLARLAGHHITAMCGARNINLVKSLGANDVLDYRTLKGQQMTTSGKLYDYAINCVPSTEWSNALDANLTNNGRVIEVTPTPVTVARYWAKRLTNSTKKLEVFMLKENKEDLQLMVGLVRKGLIRTVLNCAYNLDKAQEAWEKCMGGHATGKIIVQM